MNLVQISWADVNRAERAGPYIVERLRSDVFVQESHIENWKADPDGQRTITAISTTVGKIYGLGAFEASQKD